MRSINNILIELSQESWKHILENHPEVQAYSSMIPETIIHPDEVYIGRNQDITAIKILDDGKYLVVIYKEYIGKGGFIRTAFLTRRRSWFEKREKIWPR